MSVYDRYHRILEDTTSFYVNMGLALSVTGSAFVDETLKTKWLKKCLPAHGNVVLEQVKAMHREDQERLKAIIVREASAEGDK